MTLVAVDLPAPDQLRGRWAADAAVNAAVGWADTCRADGRVWHFDDGGGNWCDLILLDGGRAVLQGNDHEYSETYFRYAATYFGEEETDLLAEAPEWWGAQLPPDVEGEWIGFIYGYENGSWQRAGYDLEDGFSSVGLPAKSDDDLLRAINDVVPHFAKEKLGDESYAPPHEDILALAAAGPALTEAQLAAVFGPVPANLAAGVAAARAFAG
jgi:hypothetical protein